MEGEVVVEAFFGEEGEGVGGLRRPRGVERDVEGAAAGLDDRGQLLRPSSTVCFGALKLTCFGFGASTCLQPPALAAVASSRCRCRRRARSGSPRRRRSRSRAKTAEDDPALVDSAPPSARKPRRIASAPSLRSIAAVPSPPLTPLAAAVAPRRPPPERVLEIDCGDGDGALFLAREFPAARVRGRRPLRARRSARRAPGSGSTPRAGSPSRSATPRALPYPDDFFDLVAHARRPPARRRDRPGPAPGGHLIVAQLAARDARLRASALAAALAPRTPRDRAGRGRRGRRRQLLCRPPARRRAERRRIGCARWTSRACRWRCWSTRPRPAAGR